MAFLRDDDALAFAVLALCDALEERDADKARERLMTARKHAHRVIDRGKKKPAEMTPADEPAERNPE